MSIDQVTAGWKAERLPEAVRRPVVDPSVYFKWRTVGCVELHNVLLPHAVRILRGIAVQLNAEADVAFDVFCDINSHRQSHNRVTVVVNQIIGIAPEASSWCRHGPNGGSSDWRQSGRCWRADFWRTSWFNCRGWS